MKIVRRTRLFTLILSVVVTVAMVVSISLTTPVYAAGVDSTYIWIHNDMSHETNTFKVTDIRTCSISLVKGTSRTDFTGNMDLVIQQNISGSWENLLIKTISVQPSGDSFINIIYNNKWQPSDLYISLDVGKYRIKGDFLGDSYYDPISTNWYEFEILPGDPVPAPVISKSTPVAYVEVMSGNVKNGKLNAALTVPTVSFSLKSANGITPTGNASFTLQKKSGSKWKSTSQKTVTLSNGKASHKLAKANNAGTYRVQVSYSGDSKYNAVTTAWTTIKIANGKGTLKKKATVYKKASTKSKKLTTFNRKKKITITGTSGKYFKVSYKSKGKTKIGYIAKKCVKVKI